MTNIHTMLLLRAKNWNMIHAWKIKKSSHALRMNITCNRTASQSSGYAYVWIVCLLLTLLCRIKRIPYQWAVCVIWLRTRTHHYVCMWHGSMLTLIRLQMFLAQILFDLHLTIAALRLCVCVRDHVMVCACSRWFDLRADRRTECGGSANLLRLREQSLPQCSEAVRFTSSRSSHSVICVWPVLSAPPQNWRCFE